MLSDAMMSSYSVHLVCDWCNWCVNRETVLMTSTQSRIKTSGGPEASFNWRPPLMGARRKFSRGWGGKPPTPTPKIFGRVEGANEHFCVFRDILTTCIIMLWVYIASAGGASKIFRCFVREQHMTSFSNFRGGWLLHAAAPNSVGPWGAWLMLPIG